MYTKVTSKYKSHWQKKSQWERPKFDPPPPINPSSDRHQNLTTWLRRLCLPFCKISSRSDKWFCFCACVISRIKLFTRLFVRVGFFKSSTAKTPTRILTQNTSKDAVPRKDVPFGGRKTKSLALHPFLLQKPPFVGLRNFRSTTPLTLDMYYIGLNDP